MKIVKATKDQYKTVRCFYHSCIDGMMKSAHDIGWKKDIYPSPEFLQQSISDGNLYIGVCDHAIVSAMVLNNHWNEGYEKFHWPMKVKDTEVLVIHALGVDPEYGGQGYAKTMVKKAVEVGRKRNVQVIRLDVLKGNVPAERLYTGLGFKCLGTIQMYYKDTGWTDYELYEYVLWY